MPEEDEIAETEETAAPGPAPVDGASAAAILLMLLGEAEAADILRNLAPEEVKALGKAMFDSAGADETMVEAALDKFVQQSRSISALSIGAEPRIRHVITTALGNVRADNILSEIAPQSSAAALDILRWMGLPTIGRILLDEHPQVSALVLAVLNPDIAAAALAGLDDPTQADLLYRAARLTSVNADAIADLEGLLERYSALKGAVPKIKLGGRSDIAKIVNSMAKPAGERALKTVKKRDKALGQEIEDEMFIFENLIDLDAKSLGALLRAVESEILTLALKGASTALADKALGAMSARAAQSIRDDMNERGPVKRSDVEEAQKSVIMTARRLAEDGTVQLGAKSDDYV